MRNATELAAAFSEVLSQPWFEAMGLVGTVAFSFSGVIIARTERYSLFGAFVLAALPAVGGGLVRDFVINRPLPAAVASPTSLLVVIGVVTAAFLYLRVVDRLAGRSLMFFDLVNAFVALKARIPPRRALECADAIGLAAFTLTGVGVAFGFAPDPHLLWAPLLAGLTGAGGGILRDLFRPAAQNPMLRTSFYAEIAVGWGFLIALTLTLLPQDTAVAASPELLALAFVGVLATRLAVIARGLPPPRF